MKDYGKHLCLLVPMMDEVRVWLKENVKAPDDKWRDGGLVVEPHCVMLIVEGLQKAGFTNRSGGTY